MSEENYWGDFKIEDLKTPKEILKAQGEVLSKLTKDVVYGDVEDLEFGERYDYGIEDEEIFAYKFVIKSKFLEKYKFTMFDVIHDISLFPAKISLDEQITRDLGLQTNGKFIIVKSEDEFIKKLKLILTSKRTRFILNALIKLSI